MSVETSQGLNEHAAAGSPTVYPTLDDNIVLVGIPCNGLAQLSKEYDSFCRQFPIRGGYDWVYPPIHQEPGTASSTGTSRACSTSNREVLNG
jgi:hypothetical protein